MTQFLSGRQSVEPNSARAQLKLSLKVRHQEEGHARSAVDPGPAGFDFVQRASVPGFHGPERLMKNGR
jgi:hypothetical protein